MEGYSWIPLAVAAGVGLLLGFFIGRSFGASSANSNSSQN